MYHYLKPKFIFEALQILADKETRFPILAGGTDLLVQFHAMGQIPQGIIDISRIEELDTIINEEGVVEIGSLVTHAMIVESKIIHRNCPELSHASSSVGAIQIQNRGTIGGNIMTASPAADTLPVLMAFDAKLELDSLKGKRTVSIHDFFVSYKKTVIKPDELLIKIILPIHLEGQKSSFYKIGTRKAQSISKISLCVRSVIKNNIVEDIAIALGSVAPLVIRAVKTEGLLKGRQLKEELITEACEMLSSEINPIDDIRSTASYRRFVAGNLLKSYLIEQV